MEIPDKAINEFIEIFKRKFGIKLKFKEAKLEAINFLELFALISS